MSHLYGTLKGARGEATRCGTKASGLTTWAASWDGAVRVSVWYDAAADQDMVEVTLTKWHGRGVRTPRTLYRGRIDGEPEETARRAVAALRA